MGILATQLPLGIFVFFTFYECFLTLLSLGFLEPLIFWVAHNGRRTGWGGHSLY
jgi:hypothetical protein